MSKLKHLTLSLIASGLSAGIANSYPLPNDVASPVPPDVQPYYNLYVTKGQRPCPSTLTPASNADILRGKADLMDALAGVSTETGDTAEQIAEIYDQISDIAGEAGDLPWAKNPYVKAAVAAVEHGCAAGGHAMRCVADAEKDEASQLDSWADEARRQAEQWDAIKKACGTDYYIND
tara:strand:- start:6068 stop:6598 length:531 start_codon:yes stop_codon:yes gene_type:complete